MYLGAHLLSLVVKTAQNVCFPQNLLFSIVINKENMIKTEK
jgi:hypothetical protein